MNHKVILRHLALATLFAVPVAGLAQAPTAAVDTGQLRVTASAKVTAAPDVATLSASLWERTDPVRPAPGNAADPQAVRDARARLEQRMRRLILALERLGMEKDAIRAGSLTVSQESVQHPSPDSKHPQWLIRTRVERPLTVELREVDLVPYAIDTLTEAGANAVHGVTYSLSDREAAYNQALTQALDKARQRAHTLASGLGTQLVDVLLIEDADAAPRPAPPQYPVARMASLAQPAEAELASEYRPGSLVVNASVSVTWAIADAP